MADSAPVMLWISGTDGRCTYFNRGWLEFTGRSLDEELGDGWVAGVHDDDRARCVRTYQQTFAAREPFSMEYRLRRRDGAYRWVLDNGVPSFEPDGAFAGYIGSAIDVTRQKLAEEARASLNHKLLRALEDERARIARELHDDFAQRIALMAMELGQIRSALAASDHHPRLQALFDDAVEFSRDLSRVSHRLHCARLDHLGLPGAAAAFCQEVSEQHGVRVSFAVDRMPDRLPRELALNLFRVLQEAVMNAVKYAGVPEVHVMLRGRDVIRLDVADAGTGFDVDTGTTRGGLGLLSMRERAALIGGTLAIRSSPGRGTRVSVRVPLAGS